MNDAPGMRVRHVPYGRYVRDEEILTTHPRPRSSPAHRAALVQASHGHAGRCYGRKAREGGGRCIGRTCRPPGRGGEEGPAARRRIGKDSAHAAAEARIPFRPNDCAFRKDSEQKSHAEEPEEPENCGSFLWSLWFLWVSHSVLFECTINLQKWYEIVVAVIDRTSSS